MNPTAIITWTVSGLSGEASFVVKHDAFLHVAVDVLEAALFVVATIFVQAVVGPFFDTFP